MASCDLLLSVDPGLVGKVMGKQAFSQCKKEQLFQPLDFLGVGVHHLGKGCAPYSQNCVPKTSQVSTWLGMLIGMFGWHLTPKFLSSTSCFVSSQVHLSSSTISVNIPSLWARRLHASESSLSFFFIPSIAWLPHPVAANLDLWPHVPL